MHDTARAGVLGPVRGALYLAVAVTALLGRGLTTWTRVGALAPVLSGPPRDPEENCGSVAR
nr:hypothetical protein [Rhodococcus wratislaviensis]GLK37897.1 hypothetical protein GCM10017611_47620 [Rhodococcus wratislaviensis]